MGAHIWGPADIALIKEPCSINDWKRYSRDEETDESNRITRDKEQTVISSLGHSRVNL